jgi:hypothetical protein
MIAVLDCLEEAETELVRTVLSQGPAAVDRNHRFSQRYDALWCSGAIDGPQMQALIAEWGEWIQETAGNALWTYLQAVLGCIATMKGLNFRVELEQLAQCDDAFAGFLKLIDTSLLRGFGLTRWDDRDKDKQSPVYPAEMEKEA